MMLTILKLNVRGGVPPGSRASILLLMAIAPTVLGIVPYSGLLYHTPEKERLIDASEFPKKRTYTNPSTPVET